MKQAITFLFLCAFGLVSVSAQTALNPNEFVNTQITASGVYTVEAGEAYAFDGRIDLTFDVTIQGPDDGWIMEAANPPVLVNTPSADGAARSFFEIKEGGSLTLKNVLFSGTNNNGEVAGTFVANTGGSKMIVDNCAFADWQDFALRNQNKGDSISITNSVFINGLRLRNSPWGGFPLRMDVACDNVLLENNSVVNSGRLIANSGPFNNATIHELHNTYLNQTVAGHEQRANEFITANNIFYNFHFIGYKTEFHSNPNNTYDSYFTTWNYFADSKDNLDSVSLYLGQNLFYREQAILDWFDTVGGDSIAPSLLWEHADVDSFILADNDYTIGANYAELDPGFTMHPGNTQAIVNYINGSWIATDEDWSDWTIETKKEYSNLEHGKYTFQLRAKNAFGRVSDPVSYTFSVLPPWYKTTAAQAGFVICAFLLLLALIRYVSLREAKKTEEVIEQSELTIKIKEEEHQREKEKSENEIIRLRNEKLRSEVSHKNAELASTTMHLVQKSEMLQNIKKDLTDLSKEGDETVKKRVKQIQRLITDDVRLDKNWERFETHFDQVHANFFKNLRAKYPELTPKDQKLCAYLRMNLATKEIAPLLNISVRGVEISRYRLRKKLNLDPDVNLVSFIMEV